MRSDGDVDINRPNEREGENTRDKRGRWVKGHCPNRKGRPRKKRLVNLDSTDLRWFANTLIEVRKGGEPVLMTRKAVLYEKIFESATKDGKISMMKFLYDKFYENDKNLAELSVWYQELVRRWITENPDWSKPGYELPNAVATELVALRDLLKHYYPEVAGDNKADEN